MGNPILIRKTAGDLVTTASGQELRTVRGHILCSAEFGPNLNPKPQTLKP